MDLCLSATAAAAEAAVQASSASSHTMILHKPCLAAEHTEARVLAEDPDEYVPKNKTISIDIRHVRLYKNRNARSPIHYNI